MRLRPLLTVLVLHLASPGLVGAQEAAFGGFSDFDQLSLSDLLDATVSIAAGRIQSLEEAPSIVSVITADDIRRSGALTLEDVLETVPGFEVLIDEIGRKRIAVRGIATQGTSENVLVLLNGHRLNDHLWGGATAMHITIPVQTLRQIEVVRGPGSALFGSNAFVGVVNLVTWDAGSFNGVEVSAGAGDFGSRNVSVVTGHSAGALDFTSSINLRTTDGYRLPVAVDAATLIDQANALLGIPPVSLAPGRTRDSQKGIDVYMSAGYKALTFEGMYSGALSDGFIGRVNTLGTRNELNVRHGFVSVRWDGQLGPETTISATAGYDRERYYEDTEALPPGYVRVIDLNTQYHFPDGVRIRNQNSGARYSSSVVLNHAASERNDLIVGMSFEQESSFNTTSTGNFDPATGASRPTLQPVPAAVPADSRTVVSAFAQDTWSVLPQLGLTAGVRLDRYDDFGSTVTPRLGVVWRLPASLHLKALYGRAFRAPTFSELSFGFAGNLQGNPDLGPATINTFEAGLGYRRPNLRVGVNYFAAYIRDFIISTKPFSLALIGDGLTYYNSPGLDVSGLEFEFRQSFGFDRDVFANYTYQDVVDLQSSGTPGGVPEHLANVGFTTAVTDYFSVSPTVLVRSKRARSSRDPREETAGYALLNVNVRLRNIFETVELALGLRNVLDKGYVDPAPLITMPGDYPRPGRQLFIKGSYKF